MLAGLLALGSVLGAEAGDSNSLMDISPDARLLACTNRDSGTLTIVDLRDHSKRHEVAVGRHPEGATFVGDSHQVAVAVYDDDRVVLVDADQGTRTGHIEVFDEPYGVVSNAGGTRLYVTLDYPGRILEVDVAARSVTRELDAGPFLRGVAISEAEGRLYVTEYYTSRVAAVDLDQWKVVDEWTSGAASDNLCRQLVLHPSRPKAYLPHIRSRTEVAHGAGSVFPYVTVLDREAGEGRRRKRIPMDAFLGNRVTANPWEAAISPDGQQFYVVFAGTDDMFACRVLNDNYREIEYRSYVPLGRNPRAVRVSPDNRMLYVYQALDFNIAVYDTSQLKKVATIPVCANPLSETVHRGKVLFYSALQPMVGRRWISCSSCHPDGQPDGRTWQNPEGLRNTQSLRGLAWTHPVHWSADRDEVQDFEHTIRGPLMQGRGLIQGKVQTSLGAPNAKLSRDLDALASYTNSHEFTLSPYAKQGLSQQAQQGREIFFSAKTGCATCHSGPLYTDSRPRPADQLLRHDVGTGHDDPSEKMGPAFDTPTLLGLYRTAPYLHHGRAETLRDVLTRHNPRDQHGVTSHLSDAQIDALVAFLKALPYEDPLPKARQLGLPEVR